MKHNPFAAIAAAALSLSALASPQAFSQASDPSVPVGSLSAYPTIVQTGTKPTLTWSISYPSQVRTVVTVELNGTINPLRDLYLDLRVLGAQIGDGSSWYMVEAYHKLENAAFTRFFKGKQTNVNPSTICHTQLIHQGRTVNIRGRVASNNSTNPTAWQTYYETGTTTKNVKALVNGDSPPSYVPAFANQSTIKSTLGPYIDASGKIKIGPMDVIYIFELWGTATNQSYFEMQDLVVLATFRIP